MKLPPLTEAHEKFKLILGDWEGEDKIYPGAFGDAETTARSFSQNILAFGGFGVVHDYIQTQEDGSRLHLHAILQYNQHTSDYVFDFFSVMGRRAFSGRFDDKKLELVQRSARGAMQLTYDFSEEGVCKFLMQTSSGDGDWAPAIIGEYQKKQ